MPELESETVVDSEEEPSASDVPSVEPGFSAEYRQAQAEADQAWAAFGAVHEPLFDRLMVIVAEAEGTTGMAPGPGAQKLTNIFLDFAAQDHEQFATMANARTAALAAEARRNVAEEAMPLPAPPSEPPMLETTDPLVVRDWLRNSNDPEVEQALLAFEDADKQRAWGEQLLAWARIDGNQSGVFDAINRILGAAAATVNPSLIEGPAKDFASADDPPRTKNSKNLKPPPPPVEESAVPAEAASEVGDDK